MKKLALFATIVILATACNDKTQPTETKEEMKQELQLTQEWDKVFPLSDKVDHRKVTFETQYGLTLAADLYTPKAEVVADLRTEAVADLKSATQEPGISNPLLPAIAVSGPFGAVKEQSSGLYAMRMAERGFVALAFDPSYTGESSGEPRRTASPDINTEDFMAAVDFLSKQDNVDAERIGIIGICGWGGIALNAAAADPRIKATVASTMYDMTRISGNDYNDAFDVEEARHKNREILASQRLTDPMAMAGGVLDTVPPQVPRFVHDYHAYYKTPRGYHKRSGNSNDGWRVIGTQAYANSRFLYYINEIRSAVLVMHGAEAHSRYFGEAAYKYMMEGQAEGYNFIGKPNPNPENKQLLIIPGASHCDLYDGGEGNYIPWDTLAEFFRTNLK
ncbi:MAG: alpha/beta hydrolase [Bacteroidales bacterium]|nr:alpha/beta hydrolase [Bacteroidales bacterium]